MKKLLAVLLTVLALVIACSPPAPAAPKKATFTCKPAIHGESRVAISGSYLTLTAAAYWRDCTITSLAQYDDPARGSLAYVWNGDPHCNRWFAGLINLTFTFTVQDDARAWRVSGSIPCSKSGLGYADVSFAPAPKLAESLRSRWDCRVVVHYRHSPDPSVTLRGDF